MVHILINRQDQKETGIASTVLLDEDGAGGVV
jgi:hypothetical protein